MNMVPSIRRNITIENFDKKSNFSFWNGATFFHFSRAVRRGNALHAVLAICFASTPQIIAF